VNAMAMNPIKRICQIFWSDTPALPLISAMRISHPVFYSGLIVSLPDCIRSP
jgi:hypothetical protein